jgi:hypothetical protein
MMTSTATTTEDRPVAPVASPTPKPPAPRIEWPQAPTQARDHWAERIVEARPALSRDEVLREIDRAAAMPPGEERVRTIRALFGSDQIDRAATDRLLDLYGREGPGDMRKVLFGALLFSSEAAYVGEQMLARAAAQDPDAREYTYLGKLPAHHGRAWDFLCESLPACRSEAAQRSAALAIAIMAGDYPGSAAQPERVARVKSLLGAASAPPVRLYLFQALLRSEAPGILDHLRAAYRAEPDPATREAMKKMQASVAE